MNYKKCGNENTTRNGKTKVFLKKMRGGGKEIVNRERYPKIKNGIDKPGSDLLSLLLKQKYHRR